MSDSPADVGASVRRVLAVIPARGGSKGVPAKNLLPVGGVPLVARAVRECLASRLVTDVVVSTDDQAIATAAREAGAEIVLRPAAIAGDTATSEAAVLHAVDEATDFLLTGGWRNVLVEVNNECDTHYEHPILQPQRVHELIVRIKNHVGSDGKLLVSTSYRGGGRVPDENVARAADFLLLHGNGTNQPDLIAEQVERTRRVPGYYGQPIVFNEDDHFDFDRPWNNFVAALSRHASWGYFDPGAGAGGAAARGDYLNGYQLVPVDWGINTERKRKFFELVAAVSGSVTRASAGRDAEA